MNSKVVNRRAFLAGAVAAGASTTIGATAEATKFAARNAITHAQQNSAIVDFRYSPPTFQTAFCFPDDHFKSIVGERGDLRYDFFASDGFAPIHHFGTIVEFTLAGLGRDDWQRQWLESPDVPIIHTLMKRPAGTLHITTFATNRKSEGRVDNVLLEIRGNDKTVQAAPVLHIRSNTKYKLAEKTNTLTHILREDATQPWLVCIPQQGKFSDVVWKEETGGFMLTLEHAPAAPTQPARYLIRIPQELHGTLDTAANPDDLLAEARSWWKSWKAFGSPIAWSMPSHSGAFLTACARNIQQAREEKGGKLVFQVGPTVYRGLWIVDGNFLLEAARYLGYDKEADDGLESEWRKQLPSGQIVASGGGEHWKDTGIVLFTLVRACELKGDWSMLRRLAPEAGKAIQFLDQLRRKSIAGTSTNGRYGLLAPGFVDGGVNGIHSDFSNTLWVLAGLRSIVEANHTLQLPELQPADTLYKQLRASFDEAAKKEMVADPRGFRYLPILTHDDPLLTLEDSWQRPRPQAAQWSVSHSIFPGLLFAKDDPIVRGHIALMQACTQEDIPAETGWMPHEAVWGYNAAFVAEVYLWASLHAEAHRTFTGFLNHASPLYAWREEQALQHALIAGDWGDMPHNWASAECIRYLRHTLVLEDGPNLRLLEGLTASDLHDRTPFQIQNTPTRFGRISLHAEPTGTNGWRVTFRREGNAAPQQITLPSTLGSAHFIHSDAAIKHLSNGMVTVDPTKSEWSAAWS